MPTDDLYQKIRRLASGIKGEWRDHAQRLLGQADCWRRSLQRNGEDLAAATAIGDVGDCAEARSRGLDDQVQMRFASQQLHQVLLALQRMEEGEYGRCEVCGWQIPPERLRAVPEATHCVRCSSSRTALLLPRRYPAPGDLYVG